MAQKFLSLSFHKKFHIGLFYPCFGIFLRGKKKPQFLLLLMKGDINVPSLDTLN